MKRKWKISSFSEKIIAQAQKKVVLWNRVWGGTVCIPMDSFELISSSSPFNQEGLPEDIFSLLVSQNIVVEKSCDEKRLLAIEKGKLIAEVSSKRLRCLELSVSEECNYHCLYCTFWRQKKRGSQDTKMSERLAKRLIYDFLETTWDVAEPIIYFGTAEPLLNWNVIKKVAVLAPKLHSGVKMSLITNGSMMNEERLRFCKNHRINVGVSLDGRPEIQNKQRVPFSPTTDSSEVILELLKTAKKIGFGLSCVSGTYRSANFIKEVNYLIDLCGKYQIPEVDIDFDVQSIHSADTEKLAEELAYTYKMAKGAGLRMFGYWLVPFENILNSERKLKSFCGNSIGESVCVSSDGNLKLCGYRFDKTV